MNKKIIESSTVNKVANYIKANIYIIKKEDKNIKEIPDLRYMYQTGPNFMRNFRTKVAIWSQNY